MAEQNPDNDTITETPAEQPVDFTQPIPNTHVPTQIELPAPGPAPSGLFENGTTDARLQQSKAPLSRFRPRYRQLTPEELSLHDRIKQKAEELEALYNQPPGGRYASLAMTHLEESVMFIIKELTA